MKTGAKLQAIQRRELVLKALDKTGIVSVPNLAVESGISDMTALRDLDRLAKLGQIERAHGGAVSRNRKKSAAAVDLVEPHIGARTGRDREAKIAIARAAAGLVSAGQAIALDIGSTTFELAAVLSGMTLSVYTNSLRIASYLSEERPSVHVPGGQIHGSEPSVVGPLAVKHFDQLHFDIAFVGVSGVSESGFYDYSLEDTEIKRALIERSQKTVVLIDSSKFGRMSVARVCELREVDLVVSDDAPGPDLQVVLDAAGVEILIAN